MNRIILLGRTSSQIEKYNENKSIMLQKQHTIIQTIEEELKNNYGVSNNDALAFYNKTINSNKQMTKEREHEIEVYQKMYNRLYHCNLMIKKRIGTEIVYEPMNSKQMTEYKIINNNALLAMKQKQEMLNQIKKYAETYQIKHCDEINMQKK